jgi:two-component system, sensor histidine kinase
MIPRAALVLSAAKESERGMASAKPTLEMQATLPALEALADGVCILDRDWRITYWNAAAERLLGLRRQRMLGTVVWNEFPLLRGTATWDVLRVVRAEGKPRDFTEALPRRQGRGFAAVHAAPMADGSLLVQFRDATEEVTRRTEHTNLLESIRDGFIAVDSGWRVVYINRAAESLLRFSREQALGLSLWPLLPQGSPEIGECLRATMQDGMHRHLREVRPEGRVFRGRIFDLWIYPLHGGGISIMFENVSDRVKREQELARLVAKANEANEAKGRFFAAISHELRTPLNAIIGYTHLLNTDTYGGLPEAAHRAAERAGVCAEHLARLVDDVLLLTTAEIGKLPVISEEIVLADFLPSILEPHRHQAEAKGLAFQLRLGTGAATMETDPQRLRQLLASVVTNAVKFTASGMITVDVTLPAPGEEGEPQIEFRVQDTGRGIDPADQDRIFGPFEQIGDPARSQSMTMGSGLGLTVARRLASLLSGTLQLERSSPQGSCFCLRLPLRIS